jgi:CheY-like chemotaxis protein
MEHGEVFPAASDFSVPPRSVLSKLTAAASHDLRQCLRTVRRLQVRLARTQTDPNSALLLEEATRVMDKTLADIKRMEAGIAEEREPPLVMTEPRIEEGIKVLHIEDDPSVARSMARLLGLRGYKVVSAATRDEVMRHLEVNGLRPDLILTDSQLALGVTGEELVKEVATRLQFKPPTILLTSDTGANGERAKAIADRILPKPVDVNTLLREIGDLLGRQP